MKIALKILKWLGIAVGAIVLLVVIASVAMMFIVDKDMIAHQMEKALNRHVTIGDINVSILSVVSGIEVRDVRISNFKTPAQLEALKGKPVAEGELFVGLKSFTFKLRFLPLLSKQFVLRELVLREPVINVVRYPSKLFNFSDLTAPKKLTAEERAELEKKKKEDEAKKKAEGPAKPFTADDLPIEITIGKVGVEKGLISFTDQGLGQKFQAYNLTALVHSIEIDPKDLTKKNSVGLKFETGLKTIGQVKTKSIKSFDLGVSVNGRIKPFDAKSKKADPEVSVKAGSTYGTLTGLQIFESLKSVEALSKYCGKLDFLKGEVNWKEAFVDLWYKGGTAKLSNGKIKTKEFGLDFAGSTNINTKAIDLDIGMVLAKKHTRSIRGGIEGNAKKALKAAGVDKYLKPDKVADAAMKPLVNKDGDVALAYKVTGTMSDPDAKLVAPKLGSLGDVIKDMSGDIKDMVKEEAKKAVEKKAEKATGDALKGLKKKKLKIKL